VANLACSALALVSEIEVPFLSCKELLTARTSSIVLFVRFFCCDLNIPVFVIKHNLLKQLLGLSYRFEISLDSINGVVK
jgi:hypothetical protein